MIAISSLFSSINFLTPEFRVASVSFIIAVGTPDISNISFKSYDTVPLFTTLQIFIPIHSQSSNDIALPLSAKTLISTLNTTNSFLIPILIEWSIIATQGGLTFLTSFSIPTPTRFNQLIVDVKCGIQPILRDVWL